MRTLIVILTTFVSFFSLLAVVIGMKQFGFSPANFHNPEMVFDGLTMLATALILIVPIILTLFAQKFLLKEDLRKLLAGPFIKPMIFGTFMGLGLKLCATVITYLLSPEAAVSFVEIPTGTSSYLPYLAFFFVTLFLNSASEELVYRAFPLSALWKDDLKFLVLLGFVTAALFSLAHFLIEEPEVVRFFYRLSFGFLAAVLYIRTRSIWQIVGLHTGWNFIALSVGDADWRSGALLHLIGIKDGYEGVANSVVLFSFTLFFLFDFLQKTKVQKGQRA